MLANFHNRGNSCRVSRVFIVYVRGDVKCSATSLMNLVEISSGPVEQSERRPLVSRKTSS